MSATDIYGSDTSSVQGFGDAYQKVWYQNDRIVADRVARFTSALWAAVRIGESKAAAKKNKGHTSFGDLSGFGAGAYEVTDPSDSNNYQSDTMVFAHGDYLAVVSMAVRGDVIPHEVLLDQARRQTGLLPISTAEYQAIGSGVLVGGLVIALVIAGFFAAGGIIVFVVLRRGRRPALAGAYGFPPAASPAATPLASSSAQRAAGTTLSADRRFWWDGNAWQDASVRIPPGAPMSPDGTQWWDGTAWRPVPPPGRPAV